MNGAVPPKITATSASFDDSGGLRSTPCFQRGGTSPRHLAYFLDKNGDSAMGTEVLSESWFVSSA